MAVALAGLVLASVGPAQALDDVSLTYGNYWRVAFSSVEIEKASAFLSSGAKLGVSNPTNDVALFIASSQGYSLSDGERAFRLGWPANRVETQSRMMVGLERSEGKVFVSLAAGVSQARMQAMRQPDPNLRLVQLARQYDVDLRLLPVLLISVAPSTIRGLLPPHMKDHAGAVVDLNVWWRPDNKTYLHWAVVGDSAAQSLWTRLRAGAKLGALPFSFGPEAATAVGRNWHKYKVGLHLGDLKLWRFELAAAGGWIYDETRRWGTYGSLALHTRF